MERPVTERRIIETGKSAAAIGPYAQANLARGFIFISGQIPLDPESSLIAGNTIEEQTEQVIKNLKAILEAAGAGLDSIVKTTVFLTNLNDFAKMNEVYARYFTGDNLPSRSTVEVSALPKGALVEIEAIALAE